MPPHPLTNFEIQKFQPKEPKFKNIYSRNNLRKTKNGAECKSIETFNRQKFVT